jgi:transposase-like protein
VTLTGGTALDKSKVPVRTWLLAAWYVTQTKVGLSALTLQRMLGCDYTTAWSLLHKLRGAMDQTGRARLSGDVEVDESYVGGDSTNKGRAAKDDNEVVLIACEVLSDKHTGRIRVARARDASVLSLAPFIEANIEPGSTVLTDGWVSYPSAFAELAAKGLEYNHKATSLSAQPRAAHEVMPHVHRVASLLKRWLLGAHQGAVQGHHLDAYLDEFVFRFNRRASRDRGLLFWRLVCALTQAPAVTRAELSQRGRTLAAADKAHDQAVKAWNRKQARERTKLRRLLAKLAPSDEPF